MNFWRTIGSCAQALSFQTLSVELFSLPIQLAVGDAYDFLLLQAMLNPIAQHLSAVCKSEMS